MRNNPTLLKALEIAKRETSKPATTIPVLPVMLGDPIFTRWPQWDSKLTDACHSETSFRSAPTAGRTPRAIFKGSLLSLSGCADDKLSWGDWRGGKFTRALLAELRPNISYTEWFWAASSRMGKGQVPKLTEVGPSFTDRKALT